MTGRLPRPHYPSPPGTAGLVTHWGQDHLECRRSRPQHLLDPGPSEVVTLTPVDSEITQRLGRGSVLDSFSNRH